MDIVWAGAIVSTIAALLTHIDVCERIGRKLVTCDVHSQIGITLHVERDDLHSVLP
jgi:hypothetical protein